MSLTMTGDLDRALRLVTDEGDGSADVVPLAVDREPVAPATVAEAELALRAEFEALRGQYRPESVTTLLDLLDTGAEDVAAHERERWVDVLNTVAARACGQEFRAALRHAARLIAQNRRTTS